MMNYFFSSCVEIRAEDDIGWIDKLVVGRGGDANTEVIVGLAMIIVNNIIITNEVVLFCQLYINIFYTIKNRWINSFLP